MLEINQITQFLNQNDLDDSAWEQVLPIVYKQLKHLARKIKADHKASPTLNTTALVHDVYLKIKKSGSLNIQGRKHFYRLAAKAMRQILIDAARAKQTGKRAGHVVEWEDDLAISIHDHPNCSNDDLLVIDQALIQLNSIDPKMVELIELHFFAGYGFAQVAEIMETSESTVFRMWKKARALLYAHIY